MRLFFILCLVLITIGSFDTPQSAQAIEITVDGTNCTLVDAIIAANTDAPSGGCPAGNGADVITLDVDVTITTPYDFFIGLPSITSDITIQAGAGTTISGNATDILLFDVEGSNARLTLEGLTIQDSRHLSWVNEPLCLAGYGGAIYIGGSGAEVYISNSLIRNNAAIGITCPDGNGGDAFGGAIYNEGYLEINNSIFQNNLARGGDALMGEPGGYALGGAVFNDNVMFVQSTTFDGNIAESGNSELLPGGVGGAILSGGITTVNDSIFLNNSAQSRSQSPIVGGGAMYIGNSSTTVERSLFMGNTAYSLTSDLGLGGAILIETENEIQFDINISNSTFFQNSADVGGTIVTRSDPTSDKTVFSFNTLFANTSNLGADAIAIIGGEDITLTGNVIASLGGSFDCFDVTAATGSNNLNLAGDTSCNSISSGNILPGTHFSTTLTDEGLGVPKFLPLFNVGGNPAINAVPGCGLTEDQRGLPRDANCDVGSYELQSTSPALLVASAACVDENLAVTISAGDGPFNITASAGINTPVNGVGIGTTTINGPEKWDNLTVVETSGDMESVNLGQFKCRSDERPVPVSPAHRSRTTNPFPTFSWTGISNANNYRVFVFDDANPATRTVDIRQNSGGPTMLTLTTPLPNGRLFWRVRGRQNRIWSLWSIRFTLFKDPPPPLIAPTPVPTIDLDTAPTIPAPQPTVVPTFPSPPNSR